MNSAAMKGHGLLDGKVVVITAAAGTGIGGAAARRCLEEGARVAISDQHHQRLAAARDELARAHAGRVWAQPCDVTDEAQVTALIRGAAGHFGRIDVMINNAGLGGTASVLEMTDEQWSRVLDVTLNGTFRCTRAALRQMVAQGHGGAVVNNASALGWRAQPGHAPVPGQGDQRGTARRPGAPRGVRPRGGAVGGGQRDRVPGQRSSVLPDRRGARGEQPASLRRPA